MIKLLIILYLVLITVVMGVSLYVLQTHEKPVYLTVVLDQKSINNRLDKLERQMRETNNVLWGDEYGERGKPK